MTLLLHRIVEDGRSTFFFFYLKRPGKVPGHSPSCDQRTRTVTPGRGVPVRTETSKQTTDVPSTGSGTEDTFDVRARKGRPSTSRPTGSVSVGDFQSSTRPRTLETKDEGRVGQESDVRGGGSRESVFLPRPSTVSGSGRMSGVCASGWDGRKTVPFLQVKNSDRRSLRLPDSNLLKPPHYLDEAQN